MSDGKIFLKNFQRTIDSVTMLCYNCTVTMLREEENMENENLISKKELLERYGISYGALYRWKRKGLIPDEWFIKKSTVTGQETFFPEKLVCERVEMILLKKEDVLLDELAREISVEDEKNEFIILNTAFGEKSFRLCDVRKIEIVDARGNKTDIISYIRKALNKE